jgi:LPS O-antigen subunit length determinant protein (WzzB/FepE family)
MEKMNLHLLSILWKKRKSIFVVGLVSCIASVIISLVITPRYKSEATIYPANLTSYSDETPTEQLMQFLNSVEVKEIIRKKYNLYKHYEIDSSYQLAETYYFNTIKENVIFNQTKYGSIEIIVFDKSPKMAKDLVEGIIDAVNEHIRQSKNDKIAEYNQTNLMFMGTRKKSMDSVDILLKDFSEKFGINNYSDKIENAAKYYYKSIPEGRSDALSKKLDELELQGIEEQWKERKTKIWSEQFKIYMGDFNASLQELDKGVRDMDKKITYTTIASKPVIPQAKDAPKRSIIVIVFTLTAVLMISIYYIFEDKLKSLKEVVLK